MYIYAYTNKYLQHRYKTGHHYVFLTFNFSDRIFTLAGSTSSWPGQGYEVTLYPIFNVFILHLGATRSALAL